MGRAFGVIPSRASCVTPSRVATRGLLPFIALASFLGCAASNQYGHAPDYVPLPEETRAAQGSVDYDPVMSLRTPEHWGAQPVRLFGVVKTGERAADGSHTFLVSVRTLAERNLCENEASDSCRVTVSDKEFDSIRVTMQVPREKLEGEEALGSGSLVRLVGKLEPDAERPNHPKMRVDYFRHWPRGFFVTTAARDRMRR